MDREYTEYINGIALVVTVQQLEPGVWAARTTSGGIPYETRASAAHRAREALLVALRSEMSEERSLPTR